MAIYNSNYLILIIINIILISYVTIATTNTTTNNKNNVHTISCLPNSRFTIVSPRIIRIEYINDVKEDTFEDRSSTAFAHRISMSMNDIEINNSTDEWCNISIKVAPYLKISIKKKNVNVEDAIYNNNNNINNNDKGTNYFQMHELSISNSENDDNKPLFNWNINMKPTKNLLGTIPLTNTKISGMNTSGVDLANCCTNPSYPSKFDPKYPLELGLISRDGWSVIDDSSTPLIDNGTGDFDNGWKSEKGRQVDSKDLFFFGCGHEYATCLNEFVQTSGKISVPTNNALGIWWSRHWGDSFDHNPFGPMTADAIMTDVVEGYSKRNLPLNIVVLDMEWHSQTEYPRCDEFIGLKGWGGYTFNKTLFPDHIKFIDTLHSKDIHLALNFHPDQGIDACQDPYVKFANALGIDPNSKVKLPDLDQSEGNETYANAYFTYCIEPLNVDIAWTDTAEATTWSNYLYVRYPALRKNKRTINFSRYTGIGDQRKPIGFSGDALRKFDTLQYEVYMTPRAGNVGFGWWSHDIGGFKTFPASKYVNNTNHTESAELFLRWLQFATFAPIFRTHCRFCEQRIWTFGEKWYPLMKETMMERHRLFPYINTHAHLETYAKGRSLLVPIYWSSNDAASMDEAYDPLYSNTEYLFGRDFLVAPITHSLLINSSTKEVKKIWLPPGEWQDWRNTSNVIVGPKILTMENLQLSDSFVFVNKSTIIPTQQDVVMMSSKNQTTMTMNVTETVEKKYPLIDPVVWIMFPSNSNSEMKELSGELFEDDGVTMDYRKNENSGIHTIIRATSTSSKVICHVNSMIGSGLSMETRKILPSHRRHWFKMVDIVEKDNNNIQYVECDGKQLDEQKIGKSDDVDKIMMGNDEGYWIDEQEPNSLFINCGYKAVQSFSNNNEKMNFEVVVKFMS